MTMTVPQMVRRAFREAKDTVGFNESANQEEFQKGAEIGIAKMSIIMEEELHKLEVALQNQTQETRATEFELRTIAKILKKYASIA